MSIVTVQEIGTTRNGKPKVKAAGQWYFLARDVSAPPAGTSIEIQEGTFTFTDGGTGKTIEKWRPAGGNGHQPQPQQNGRAPAPAGYVDEASMRFISNCVGSAITSGAIKQPGQISAWYTAAKSALEGKAAPAPYDDDMPPSWSDPQ